MSGFYLALEGGEGAGKTTVSRLVAQALTDRGEDVVEVREPGSTDLGTEIDVCCCMGQPWPPGPRRCSTQPSGHSWWRRWSNRLWLGAALSSRIVRFTPHSLIKGRPGGWGSAR